MMKYIVCAMSLFLLGCPMEGEDGSYCEKIMVCQEDSENVCDRNLDGCGQNCYYYIVETCWEQCKENVINEGG